MRRLRVGAGTVSVPARDRSVEYGLFRTVITRQKALGRLRAGWPGNPSDSAFAKRMDTRVKPAYDEQRWRRPARSRLTDNPARVKPRAAVKPAERSANSCSKQPLSRRRWIWPASWPI